MAAHKTAKAYSDEIAHLVTVREVLRRAFPPDQAKQARLEVERMWQYLDKLGAEYRDNYLNVSRRQRIDEAQLKRWADEHVTRGDAPPQAFYEEMPAWRVIRDPETFGACDAFLDDSKFPDSEFMRATATRASESFNVSDSWLSYPVERPGHPLGAGRG